MISTSLPDLELQLGSPGGFISVKLPRTNIDHQDLLVQRRVAFCGAYLWDLALLLEGLSAENETPVNWDNHADVVVRMSKNLSYVLRHSAEVRCDSEGFVRLLKLMNARHSVVNNLLTLSKLLVAIVC